MRNIIVRLILLTAIISTTAATPAIAAPGHPGEPIGSIPFLRNGFGSVNLPNETTTPNGMVGAPATCGDPEGAAAYKIVLTGRAMLRLQVTELDVDGICAVGVYTLRSGGQDLDSLYNIPARADHTRTEVMCPDTCAVEQALGSNTHFVVVWPSGSGNVTRAFSMTGSVKALTTIAGSLTGRTVGSCKRIDKGGETTLTVEVSPPPAPAAGEVTVSRTSRWTGETTALGQLPLDVDGTGEMIIPAGLRGYHDVYVTFAGSGTLEPRTIRLCLIVRGPSKVEIIPKRWRYQYDDYSVWRHGDKMVFRFPVLPGTKARGRMNIRIIRQYAAGHHYKPFAVKKGIRVVDGVAVFKMPAKYLANGLPFYRIRGEWRGSHVYAPAKSPYICFQINR